MILNMLSVAGGTTGNPQLDLKTQSVTTTRTSEKVMSFSGLDVDSDETLVGFLIVYQGTPSTSNGQVDGMMVMKFDDGWYSWHPIKGSNNEPTFTLVTTNTFVKSGETGGTLTITLMFDFLEGTYAVTPIVMKNA